MLGVAVEILRNLEYGDNPVPLIAVKLAKPAEAATVIFAACESRCPNTPSWAVSSASVKSRYASGPCTTAVNGSPDSGRL